MPRTTMLKIFKNGKPSLMKVKVKELAGQLNFHYSNTMDYKLHP